MKKAWLAVLLTAPLLLWGQGLWATTITFDDVPAGTNINTQYSGVTFSCLDGTVSSVCVGGNTFARESGAPASSPNVFGIDNTDLTGILFDQRFGFGIASFAAPVGSVSIDAIPILPPEHLGAITNAPFLVAFDSGGNPLGQTSYIYGACDPDTTQCPYQTLTVSFGSDNIAFVAFSSSNVGDGTPVYGMFDNLTFTSAGGPVPEPATLALLGVALAGLGFSKRRKS